ncbi:type II secretion system F family protein [Clostridium felsineum]|uniref:Uncharacterized protein n=1 Tax=Clostridium felsineum TaxID=36839 RepID=A0A1S8L4K8_9CLOT|nr:type II secretion system F family protein [Clostridium felsineum]URZ06726.1 hypothetical protein CLROS_020590 [Clostridium felsineum]URZ11759.1 hypothetical protein CROST_024760 [Clostridium felsineum]
MLYIIKLILLICSLIIAYYLRCFIKLKFNSKYKKAKPEYSPIEKTNTINFFNRKLIEEKLVKCGNPFKLNVKSYMFLKLFILLGGAVAAVQYIGASTKGLIGGLVAAILGFFSVDIVNYLSNEDDKNRIRLDLADVYDLVSLQTVAGVNIGHALLEVHTVCKSKRLQKSLIKLAAKINLSKNIEKALNEFNSEYDMPEIDTFVAIIKESLSSGLKEEIIDDQSAALKAVNSFYTASETEKIDIYVLVISMLLLGGILGMVYYGIGSDLLKSTHGLFS